MEKVMTGTTDTVSILTSSSVELSPFYNEEVEAQKSTPKATQKVYDAGI